MQSDMRYDELRIEIGGPNSTDPYPVRMTSAAGLAKGDFRVPMSQWEVEAAYGNIFDSNRGIQRGNSLEALDPVRELGSRLFLALFSDEQLRAHYTRLLTRAEAADAGIRLRLVLENDELAMLPWEFLYDVFRQDSVALSPRYHLVRQGGGMPAKTAPALPPLEGPLRALVVTVWPDDRPDAEREAELFQRLQEEDPSLLHVERLGRATPVGFRHTLARGRFHLIHFAGTATSPPPPAGEPFQQALGLRDDRGQVFQLGAGQLRLVLSELPDLRLVFLNACRTDRLAATLGPGVPAAVGIRDVLSAEGSLAFAEGFYRALLAGRPLEAAVAQGRQAVDFRYPGRREWALPVFYLGVQAGTLLSPQSQPPDFAESWIPAEPRGGPRDEQGEVRRLQLGLLRKNLHTLEWQARSGARPLSAVDPQIQELKDSISRLEAELKTAGS